MNNQYDSLESTNKITLPTKQAAFHLDRQPQTLRVWAMRENGPIRPIRINGRLAWPVKEIKKILGLEV